MWMFLCVTVQARRDSHVKVIPLTKSTKAVDEMMKSYPETYVFIDVRHPRTHIKNGKACFTDYEILLQTNDIAFTNASSCVRRRYSDFVWLHNRLLEQYGGERKLPSLPPRCIFGRFKKGFLHKRTEELKVFLSKLLGENAFLSDKGVHFFLQTALTTKQISARLSGFNSCDELFDPWDFQSSYSNISSSSMSIGKDSLDKDSGIFSVSSSYIGNRGKTLHGRKLSQTSDELSSGFYSESTLFIPEGTVKPDADNNQLHSKVHTEESESTDYDADTETEYDNEEENMNKKHKRKRLNNRLNEKLFVPIPYALDDANNNTLERAANIIEQRLKKKSKPEEEIYETEDEVDETEYDIICLKKINFHKLSDNENFIANSHNYEPLSKQENRKLGVGKYIEAFFNFIFK